MSVLRLRSAPLPCVICGATLDITPETVDPAERMRTAIRAPMRIVEDGRQLYAQGQFLMLADARRFGITADGRVGAGEDVPARRRK